MLREHYVDMIAVIELNIGGKQTDNLCLALVFNKWSHMVIVKEFVSLAS